ncbi:hypothetical protein WJX74_001010 [Apatococcus lobatus]|uniref:Uncharacterized protein n=1 Tax=Apatococcus lobatus TaxID=904363 RepID=A0AAW1RZB3_9CHLO
MSVSTNAAPGQGQGAFAAQQPPMVVFFHGLRKKREQMLPMSRSVGQATGWEVYSLAYPSTEQPLHLLAKGMAEEVRALAQPTQPVYAVTYSMGGVLLRHMMNLPQKGGINWQGCVMIAPPNQGSRTARIMSRVFLVRKIFRRRYGQAGMELAAEIASRQVPWPDVPHPCGIIAGTRSFSWKSWISWLTTLFRILPGPADGTLLVEETRLEGAEAFTTIDCNHSLLPADPRIPLLVVQFLQHGTFDPSPNHGHEHAC